VARPCPGWRHVQQHVPRDAVTSLPSPVSLTLTQSPTALITASREHKSPAETLFCASAVSSAASHRVINKAQWERSCSPLPAAAPWQSARTGHCWGPHRLPPASPAADAAGLGAVPDGRALRGAAPCPGAAPSVCSAPGASAQPCCGVAGGWRWGEAQEGFGSKTA